MLKNALFLGYRMNTKIQIHNRGLESRKKKLDGWKIPQQEKKELVVFLDKLSLGQVNKGKRVSESRQVKYLDLLKTPLEFWNKDVTSLTLKDVERFEKSLISNKIKSKFKSKPYTQNTKSNMRVAIKIYLKWRGVDEKLFNWLDSSVKNQTPDYLTEQEAERLYKSCKNNEERFLIAVLFDSGCRAEEFHNIRYEDVQLPKNSDNFVKLSLKEEYSKTRGRVISLFWKYSLEAVKDYLQEREKEEIKSKEPIFKNSYDNARQILYRLGKRVLNKSIHYHLLRHSSATYYANKLNRQELCYRYGWAFSSRMPDVYISRAGMENKELDEKFKSTELEDLRVQLEKEQRERAMQFEAIKNLLVGNVSQGVANKEEIARREKIIENLILQR